MTTEEIAAAGAVRALPEGARAAVVDVLGSCDLVKFSGRRPAAEERTRVLEAGDRLVDAVDADGGGPA